MKIIKNKRILKLMMAFVLLIPMTMVSACSSKPDGHELMKEVVSEMKDVESMKMTMDMIMKLKLSIGGSNLKMDMDAKIDMDINNDPIAYYGNMEMNMEFLNQKETTTSQMYLISEEDQMIQYQNDGDGWFISKSDIDLEDFEKLYRMSDKLIEQLDIKVKDGEKIDGKETYQLDVTIKEDALKNIFESSEMEEGLSAVDFSDITLKYAISVDKNTKRVLKISTDLKDNFSTLLSKAMLGAQIPEGSEIAFEKMTIELLFTDFNKVGNIKVPDDVINKAGRADFEFITKGDISTQTHAWESFVVNVDNVDITLGTTSLKTLFELGYTIDESYYDVKDELEEYDFEFITLHKGDSSINVTVENVGETTIKIEDGIISSITNDSPTNHIVLPNNIKIGSTREEVIAAYGQANEIDTQYFEAWEYLVEKDIMATLSLYFDEGGLAEFSISRY